MTCPRFNRLRQSFLERSLSPYLLLWISLLTLSGSDLRAALKLYDRRFERELRDVCGKHAPLASEDKPIFQAFVQR